MSDIDPVEFGQLQAQVKALLDADKEKTDLLRTMAEQVTAIRLQLAQTEGGWKVLMAISTASASVGGFITWAISHFWKVGS